MVDTAIAIADAAARLIGIILAFGIALTFTGSVFYLLVAWFNGLRTYGIGGKVAALVLPGLAAAIYAAFFWRALRFMGGYTGSSEYPFHFVVRWIDKLF